MTQLEALPIDRTTAQLTVRAVLTGMLLGGLLSLCNIYSGLKIGWSSNMSVTAVLLAFGLWRAFSLGKSSRPFTILENNINQTAASSAASVSSAGLVAAVPALTLITGRELAWPVLALWTFSVCCVGISVASGLRRQMIIVDRLPFPGGIASAETLKEIYSEGKEATARIKMLGGAGLLAAVVKVIEHVAKLRPWPIPGSYAAKGGVVTFGNLTFAFEPSLLMIGVGGLIGLRAGISMLLGALIAYGVLAPMVIDAGWVPLGQPGALWFGALNKWLLWPGVAMMVTASLTSFAFSWRSIGAAFKRKEGGEGAVEDDGAIPVKWFLAGVVVAMILSVVLQSTLFGIVAWVAALGVAFSGLLAVVAARVGGETNVTPVGAMGKITQLLFGVLSPGQAVPNLMAANVTGGSASQCADLMHDLKAGWLLGATARYQLVAQYCGAVAGSCIGSAAYLVLIPDPATQLLTPQWPAPAVATWKAVAEIFAKGISAMPPGTQIAALVGGLAGIVLAIAEKTVKAKVKPYLPSAAALGLAFVIPAHSSFYMFLGALLAAILTRRVPSWSARFLVVAASGIIAGEGLAGVGVAIESMLSN
ncbi:MAG: OPT/YSL family transporter [Polyangiaceae bacterium]|nr:OPT/YSL family transporter [Polyangiaceae bacterium]NUQ75688.1 OPT/YSL family transporter [Polyangiaceae bacterium]